MGRYANYPTTIDELREFNISFLSKHNYLKPDTFKTGSVIWTSQNGEKNSISIQTTISESRCFLILDYTFNKTENINYKVRLIKRPSNLGTGFIWFFVCPFTGKVCRKLHLINGYFQHRTALMGAMYQTQLQSKKWREWNKYFENDFIYNELYSKNFKKTYKGKPTKKFLRLSKKIKQSEKIEIDDLYKQFVI